MLAMADQHGRVWASIPGLANIARVSLDACETALEELQSPDKYSRTTAHEGRRIEPIDGGWRLLNHAKYRAIRDEESIKESKRRYINERRAAARAEATSTASTASTVEQCRTPVERCRANTEAEAEAEIEASKTKTPRKRGAASQLVSVDVLIADGVEAQHAADWLACRKAKSLPLTATAWEQTKAEATKAGMTPGEAIKAAAGNGWAGFKASWLQEAPKRMNGSHHVGAMSEAGMQTARNAEALGRRLFGESYDSETTT